MLKLRQNRRILGTFLCVLTAISQIRQPLMAATYYWDIDASESGNLVDGTNLGGNGTWDIATSNWWPVPSSSLTTWGNSSSDIAIFSKAFAAVPLNNTVTLSGAITANQVRFNRSSYTLAGGTSLTLAGAGAGFYAELGESATINSVLAGTDGLTKSGGGSIRLAGVNTYTGVTTISHGSLVVSDTNQLGADTSAVVVTGSATRGFGGGALVVDGTSMGVNLSRNLSLQGYGPISDRSAALVSVGNNTLSGSVNMSVPASGAGISTRMTASNGTLTLSGSLDVDTVIAIGTTGTAVSTFGGVNQAGVSNYNLTGALTGDGTLEKSGGGTLILNPSNSLGFSGAVRVSTSATGQQSTVRITSNGVLGTRTASGISSVLDINAGILELRMDSPLIQSGGSNANVYIRGNGSTLFADHSAGGSALNGVANFGILTHEDGAGVTFSSRNGYGMAFTTSPVNGADGDSTFTNSLGGTLSFTGAFWSNANNTANRTMNIAGNGNTLINGNVTASAAAFNHNLAKTGTGLLTILGNAATLDGTVSVQGSMAITDFRSIGAAGSAETITLGNATTTAGNLIIGTSTAPTVANLTSSRPIVLNGTTASNSIYANQAGTTGVTLNGTITKPVATTGNLILGGTSGADNNLASAIPLTGTGGLVKVGVGTWVLSGTNLYTGATSIANGTLKLRANAATSTIVDNASGVTFAQTNQYAGGTLELVGQNSVNNVETMAALTPTDGANKLRLTPGVGGTASMVFTSVGTIGDGATVNIIGSNGTTNTVTLTGQAGLNASPRLFFGGTDFAFGGAGGVMRAPIYGTDAGFVNAPAGAALPAGADSFSINGAITAQGSQTVDTLKFNGAQSLTLSSGSTLTIRTGAANTDGAILATGGASTITGGTGLSTGGSGSLTFYVNGATDTLTIDTVLTAGTTGGITKSGAGTLILTKDNLQTGTITINEGTIQLSGTGDLGAASALTMRQATTFNLNGITPVSSVNAFTNNGTVTSIAPATFTVGGANGTGTSLGIVSGAISLTKIGTGAQSWLGNSTYTGVTTIGSTGLVTVDTLANGGLASGIGASTSDAANLVFNGSTGGLVYQGNIVDGNLTYGSRSASTDRLFTLSGTGATLSSTASNGNSIVWSNTGAIAHGIVGPQALIFTGTSTADNTFNPQLSDSGTGSNITSVTKTAAGQWNLGNSANNYTGATTISEGILGLNNNGALPLNSPLALGTTTTSGILQMSGSFTRNVAATATAGSGTVTWTGTTGSGGFAAHSTPLTVTLNNDAVTPLNWGAGGFVGTGSVQSLLLNSSTALSEVIFANAINFNAAVRTVSVGDNGNTGADFATMSGVLSGAGASGLRKEGGGILRLTGANTYTGVTDVSAGTLVVTSLGLSTSGANTATSVGVSGIGVTFDDTNAVTLGNAGTGGGILQYVGAGETSDRKIRLNSTTGSNQIHAEGSGPLILTNVINDFATPTGNKTLFLRGSNTAGNIITSILSNDAGGGTLGVTVDGGATWILTGASTYTGTTTVGAGALGIGTSSLGSGIGNFDLNAGTFFAYGADRTVSNPVRLINNVTTAASGDYSLTFSQPLQLLNAANNTALTNNIVSGKSLTFAGMNANSLPNNANRLWTLDGSGTTIINGDITTSQTAAGGLNITKNGTGILILGGTGSNTNNFNRNNAGIDFDRGTILLTASEVIGHGLDTQTVPVAYGGLTLSPELATSDTATFDLNGQTETINALTATTDGTVIIDNSSTSAATFRFGANNSTVNFGSGAGTYSISNTGAGALSIVKLGNTIATFNAGMTLSHKGITASEGGGAFNIASPVTATTGLRAIEASTLALTGGLTNPNLITSLEVGGGSTLSLLDGAGSLISNLTSLSLGNTGTGTVTLNLNIGDSATDTLTLLTGGTLNLGNTITFNMTDAGLSPLTTYTLLNLSSGGLNSFGLGNIIQGATPGGFTAPTWTVTDNVVQITTGTLITGSSWWNAGGTLDNWNDVANWSITDKTGSISAASIPGQGTDVIFIADNIAGGAAITTTLEQNFKVNSLNFEASTNPANTPASVTINPGTITTSRLEVAPQLPTAGVAISTGGPAAVTISAPFRLGNHQTWTVADATSTLTLSGSLQGEKDVTKAGAGRVILSGAADSSFNAGLTTDITVTAGNLELTNVGALGTVVNGNLANVIVNGGGFYFNGAASTIPNPISLSGGSLSAGGGTQTYSGTVNVSSASTINMADSNGPNTNTARSITLSGVVSGNGNLTIDSNNTASSGNQLGGTLTMNNAANTWTGDLFLNRGTVTLAAAASPNLTSNDVTFNSFGRVILQSVNGAVLNRTGALSFANSAVGEFQVDNTSGTLTSNYTVNQNAALTLGAGSAARIFLADAASQLNLNAGVVLNGNASISVAGGDADSVVLIDTVGISDGGNSFALAINDDTGGWAQTNTRVQINVASTHGGGTTLADGILILGNKNALGTGAFTVTGGTLQGAVDLTGANALTYATTLAGNLTVSGTNNITFNSTVVQSGGNRTLTSSLTGPAALLINQLNLAEAASVAARTLTVSGAGLTTINTLVNNDQNNILTNNMTVNTLMIGAVAISDNALVGRTLEFGGTGNTAVTGLIEDVAGGGGVAGTLQKTGTGTLTLQGTNTFTGPVNLNGGNLDFSTVTNIGGAASNLGAGSVINLGGGTLRFIGSTSQTTDRPINASVNSTLNTSGTSGAEISYTGPVNMGAFQLTLTGAAYSNVGNLSGGITQTGTAADILVNSGTWNLTGTNTFSDDVIVTGTSAILNLNSTGTLAYTAGTSNGLYSRDGAVININVANAGGVANSGSLDFILIADTPSGAAATLNMASGSSIETPRLDVGSTVIPGRTGNVTGTGLITVTSTATDYLTGIRLFDGSITANLAGVSSILKQGLADFTLSGNNSGLTGTVAATRIDAGNLILDYTTQNNNKISAVAALDMRGATLTLNGNKAAATSQTVASFTLANGGANTIGLNAGTSQALVLNLGAITRAATAGTLRVQLPTGTQDATNGITTTTAVNAFGTLGGFLTVTDATGTYFAAKSGNNIIAVTPTVAADASAWTNGQNVTNTGSSFSGTTGLRSINSLSFNHATGGTITVANTATLDLFNGGALVTSNVTGGAPTITGGRLTSSVADIIVTHDGTAPLTIASQIGLSNGVTKAGNGSLLINGAINNYTAATQILSGTLQVSGGNAIGNASSVVLSDDRASTLELLANETIGNLSGGNVGTSQVFGTVALGANTLNINSTSNATYAGVFTGSGSIVRNGTSGLGNLLFTGNSGAGFTGALVANGGLMYVEGVTTMNASSLTINKGGSFLISNNSTTRSGTRFLDTMPITLNSADGAWGTETRPSGLSIRTDQGAATNETVGVLNLASGASYFRGDATAAGAVSGIITSDIVRSNSSTINARGRGLGATAGDRNFLRIASGTANETAFAATLVGGAGAAGSKNISILPWGIGEVTTASLADANMGNSLLTYVVATGSGAGLRPLDFATEYSTFASKTANTDNLRESLAADLTGIVGQTISSLVINNSNTAAGSVNVTGTGAAQTLAVTSGTMLFTATAAVTGTPAIGINLGGFDGGITVGGTNEYVIFVQNPTSAAAGGTVTATISSPLTSSADITKSGRGTLVLSAINTAGGGARKTTLNEGILEISDLDNIGGNTGSLVFAGGTLRLGTALTDDISSRSITFLNGGGTIDTNTVNLVLANSVGSGVGGFTKMGAGTLTLGAASTYTGQTTVSAGTLATTANNATGSGGALVVGAGATLDIGTNSITHSTVTTTGASPIITGAGTMTSSGGFNFTHTGDTTVDALLAGSGGLFKNQTNVLTLNGASTYTGGTEIQSGTVAVSTLANAGVASSLGAPAAGTDASVIRLGLTTAVTALNYIGTTNSSTNRIIAMQGTTGGVTLNGNGTGAVDYTGGVAGYSTGAKTLTLSGTSSSTVVNRMTGVADGIGTITLAKSGTNLWEVYGSSSYTGATQINEGTLQIGNDNALPSATAVRLGTGATAGTFDLNGFNQTIGSLLVQTNSNIATNNIVVDVGKTLTVNGAVTIGVNADNSDTNLTAIGGGSIVINSGGAGFQIGGANGATNENRVDVDFSGLATFTANLGTGSFRLGDANSSSGTSGLSTLKLATNNTITSANIRIGDGSGNTDTHLLTLGSGTNVFNADSLNIGSAGAAIRSGGSVVFDGADTTGTFALRASDGIGRSTLNMVNTTGNTAGNMDAVLNLAGHTTDILASTVTLATRSLGTGAATATLSFDQGTLDITTLNMANRTSTGTGGATAVVNLGDSVAAGSPVTTIGSINMAVNTSSGGAVEADINITGGTVNIGTGSGTAINMANASAARTVTSDISLTGGTVEILGNILRTGGAGTENATVTLNGATLDLNGNSIGASAQTINFAAQSGTLTGLGQLNGGSTLNKTTSGVLNMGNSNTYTGGTTVSSGTLMAVNTTGSATGTGAVTVSSGATLGGIGFIATGAGNAVTVDGTLQIGGVSPTTGQTLTIATNAAALTINNLITFDIFSGEGNVGLNAGTAADLLLLIGNSGGASAVLGASSIFRINTSITSGWTAGASWKLIDWAGLTPTGTFSNLSTSIGNFNDMPDLSGLGLGWDVSALYTAGIVSIAVIPEPSRAMLLLLGILALFFRRRRD